MNDGIDVDAPMDLTALSAIAAALVAAQRGGLLEALTRGRATTAELSRTLELDPRGCERVLDVLRVHQVVQRDGDSWTAGSELSALREGPMASPDRAYALWSHAPEFLASGSQFLRSDGTRENRQAVYATVVSGLGRMFEPSARCLAEALGERLPSDEPIEVLDVGAGSAVWSLALATANPLARVTALDLPDVVPNARARAESLGVADRLTTRSGDFHTADVSSRPFDCVILANILHLETPECAASLVARAAGWVRPGGAVVIVDAFSDGSRKSEIAWSSYALHLAMRTKQGFPHRRETISEWLRSAGIGEPERIELSEGAGALAALLGRREH